MAELEAESGDRAKAIARLERLEQLDIDPELLGKLAGLYAETGQIEKAKSYAQRAAARYDALLTRAAYAWADHGAEFFMDVGQDPQRALALAQLNLKARSTPRAKALVLEAALAAKQSKVVCAFLQTITGPPSPFVRLKEAVSAAKAVCLTTD